MLRPSGSPALAHSRSLRSKMVLSLAVLLVIVVGIDEFVRLRVIAPEFRTLERLSAQKDVNRVMLAIETELEFMSHAAAHDMVQFRSRHRKTLDDTEWASEPLTVINELCYQGERVDWSALLQQDSTWIWPTDGAEKTPHIDCEAMRLPWCDSNTTTPSPDGATFGLVADHQGQLHLFAATPAHRANDSTVRAYYVVGRYFDEGFIQDLQRRTNVTFDLLPPSAPTQIDSSNEPKLVGDDLGSVGAPLADPNGKTVASISVRLPFEITKRSDGVTAIARYFSLCGILVAILMMLLFLQRTVIGRLEIIRNHTERIAASGILNESGDSAIFAETDPDEIGQLANSFDRMRMRLGKAQRRLVDSSHSAGMSLVADTVIHNVGNVLTNINSLIETATGRVDRLRVEPLERLAAQLQEAKKCDEEFAKQTPLYLRRLSETLSEDQRDLSELLHLLDDNIRHIHQVIRDQGEHARMPIRWVKVSVKSVIEDALRCCEATLDPDRFSIEICGSDSTVVSTDRSLLLQVLINLIGNAGHATTESEVTSPVIRIVITELNGLAVIRVVDNGCGMSAETLERVFEARYTTRSLGNGLGLHFCAIAVKRLGGSIHAASPGEGQGATFTVKLPLEPPVSSDDGTLNDDEEGADPGSRLVAGEEC
ncbi:MAG: ATP-binding protein [Planctomycetota bacterium]